MISDDQKASPAKKCRIGLGKKERLAKTRDFRKVYKEGRSYKAGFVILKLLQNAAGISRIGFSVSSRSIKKAFRRNRIKRLFREAYRRNKHIIKTGFDMVFIVKSDTKDSFSYFEAEKMFLNLARQARVLL